MPHFKDQSNRLYFIDKEDFSYLLPNGCTEITQEEADALRVSSVDQRSVIQSQIDTIEFTSKMNRAIREVFILTAEATAAGKGVTPAQLYTANAAYKAVKDVDNQIVILRNQLKALP